MNHFKLGALGAVVIAATWGCAQTPAQKPAAASAAAPAPAAAGQTWTQTQAQSPAGKAALVARFLEIERPSIEALARELVTGSSDPIARAASGYLQTQAPPEKRADMARVADAEFRRYFDEMYPLVRDRAVQLAPTTIGPILEQNFSESELRELNTWISSPLAKKYQGLNPQIQGALMKQLVADVRPAIEPKLRKLDADVAKALGAPTAPQGQGAGRPAGKAPSKR